MNFKSIAGIALLLMGQVALAESPKVDRNVGSDGIPVITISGDKAAPKAVQQPKPVEIPERKAFRVYQLDGQAQPRTETKVVVLSSPPPIAPNNGYGYGWYGAGPYYGGFFPGNFYNNGLNVGFRTGFTVNYQNPPVNYQNPPVNYQNPPINYQNPPVNYQPIPRGGFYRGGGFYQGGYCR